MLARHRRRLFSLSLSVYLDANEERPLFCPLTTIYLLWSSILFFPVFNATTTRRTTTTTTATFNVYFSGHSFFPSLFTQSPRRAKQVSVPCPHHFHAKKNEPRTIQYMCVCVCCHFKKCSSDSFAGGILIGRFSPSCR